MQRTIRLQLNTTPQQAQALSATLASFTTAFNYVCDYGWHAKQPQSVALHKATYYPLGTSLPTLPSQLVCAARVKASEALKSVFARLKKGRKTACPHSKLCPIRYDARSYWLKWAAGQVSLATQQGRVVLGFSLPDYPTATKYAPGGQCRFVCFTAKASFGCLVARCGYFA